MPESLKTRAMRLGFNFLPAYRRTGARVTYIADDIREVRLKLPYSWKTRNYVGTTFGGSVFSSVDGVHLVMLIKALGRGYVVWDRSATIHYKKPAKTTLYANITLDEEEIETIREELKDKDNTDRFYCIYLTDKDGIVHAAVERVLYIGKKRSKH